VKEYVGGGDSPYITLYYRSFDGEQGANTEYNVKFAEKKSWSSFQCFIMGNYSGSNHALKSEL
jgi:hypothetical protein